MPTSANSDAFVPPSTHTVTEALENLRSGQDVEEATMLIVKQFVPIFVKSAARKYGLDDATADQIVHDAMADIVLELRERKWSFPNRSRFGAFLGKRIYFTVTKVRRSQARRRTAELPGDIPSSGDLVRDIEHREILERFPQLTPALPNDEDASTSNHGLPDDLRHAFKGIHRAIEPQHRRLLEFVLLGCSMADMAEQLDKGETAVKASSMNLKRRLKEELKKHEAAPSPTSDQSPAAKEAAAEVDFHATAIVLGFLEAAITPANPAP